MKARPPWPSRQSSMRRSSSAASRRHGTEPKRKPGLQRELFPLRSSLLLLFLPEHYDTTGDVESHNYRHPKKKRTEESQVGSEARQAIANKGAIIRWIRSPKSCVNLATFASGKHLPGQAAGPIDFTMSTTMQGSLFLCQWRAAWLRGEILSPAGPDTHLDIYIAGEWPIGPIHRRGIITRFQNNLTTRRLPPADGE